MSVVLKLVILFSMFFCHIVENESSIFASRPQQSLVFKNGMAEGHGHVFGRAARGNFGHFIGISYQIGQFSPCKYFGDAVNIFFRHRSGIQGEGVSKL